MPILKSTCRLEKKLWHFENFIFFWNWKCSKHGVPTNASSTINHFVLIWSTIPPSFIEIRPLALKIWPKHHTWGSESPMWPLFKIWKTLISITSQIHFNEEGECFAPIPSLWRVPQVFQRDIGGKRFPDHSWIFQEFMSLVVQMNQNQFKTIGI